MTSDPSVSPDQPPRVSVPAQGEPTTDPNLTPARVPDQATPVKPPESAVKFTRAAALWGAMIVGFLVLILLLVFILQNTNSTTIHFFAWQWSLPVGVAVLFAAIGGGLLTVAVGSARIFQLRRAAKRNLKAGL
jgi:uncharacterized integral membrane protein